MLQTIEIKNIEINSIVKKFIENQIKLFKKQTEYYIEIKYSKLTLEQLEIYRATRFKEMVIHLKSSIKEIFGDDFIFQKSIVENMEDYSFTYTFTILDKYNIPINAIGFKVGAYIAKTNKIDDINLFFGGK